MYDAGKIVAGLIVFAVLGTSPFWLNMGKASPTPEPELAPKAKLAKTCVESKEFMKSSHMQLLNEWRDAAVRDDTRIYESNSGKHYPISLQNTCLDCHSNKDKFCDRCHNYVGVGQIYCWDCHIESKKKKFTDASKEKGYGLQ